MYCTVPRCTVLPCAVVYCTVESGLEIALVQELAAFVVLWVGGRVSRRVGGRKGCVFIFWI